MKKYIISTLTAAAAMAVPAFSAELIGSWDFTSMTNGTTGSIASSQGTLSISTGSSVVNSNGTDGYLYITPSSDVAHETTIDVSSAGITTNEGISIVMTIESFSSNNNNDAIFASIATDTNGDAAAWGESGNSTPRSGLFMANGGVGNGGRVGEFYLTYPMTVTLTLVGDTMSIYKGEDLVGSVTLSEQTYSAIAGTVTGIGLGSWDDGSSVGNESYLSISSLEIYKGDVMAVPEPSMFGLMFGLGAIGLVATRRRRR